MSRRVNVVSESATFCRVVSLCQARLLLRLHIGCHTTVVDKGTTLAGKYVKLDSLVVSVLHRIVPLTWSDTEVLFESIAQSASAVAYVDLCILLYSGRDGEIVRLFCAERRWVWL